MLEVAGSETTFRMAWECARPNAIVTVVALYDDGIYARDLFAEYIEENY